MHLEKLLIYGVFLALGSILTACGSPDGNKRPWVPAAPGKGDVSTLDKGALSFGDKQGGVAINKDEKHLYTFKATAGAAIEISMTGDGGSGQPDTFLQLTTPDGSVHTDDDGGTGYNALLALDSLPASGEYALIATTYKAAGTGAYTLALRCNSDSCVSDPGGSGGSNGISVFDDSLGQAAPISFTEATAFFAPGQTSVKVGDFVLLQRSRQCNVVTGCTDWQYPPKTTLAYLTYRLWIPGPGWSPQKSCFQFKSVSMDKVSGDLVFEVSQSGEIELAVVSSVTGHSACGSVTAGGDQQCETFRSGGVNPSGGSSCSLPNPAGGGHEPDVYPATVPLFDPGNTDGKRLRMSLLVTPSYVYGNRTFTGETDANGSQAEVQYVLYGALAGTTPPPVDLSPPTCTPTTCQAQGKTCGAIQDGCGGTLHCGNCSYPYRCGEQNTCELPPGCNLQPCYSGASVSYTCCSAGRVTCPTGSGCTCYDACY